MHNNYLKLAITSLHHVAIAWGTKKRYDKCTLLLAYTGLIVSSLKVQIVEVGITDSIKLINHFQPLTTGSFEGYRRNTRNSVKPPSSAPCKQHKHMHCTRARDIPTLQPLKEAKECLFAHIRLLKTSEKRPVCFFDKVVTINVVIMHQAKNYFEQVTQN